MTERVYCVNFALTMTKHADQLQHNNTPVHSKVLVQALMEKPHITQVCQSPYRPDVAPREFWLLLPKLNSPLKGWKFVNATVTQHTSSVNGVSLPTD